MNRVQKTIKKGNNVFQEIRSRLGAKWSVVFLLIPPMLFGIQYFGVSAALTIGASLGLCLLAGSLPRIFSGESFQVFHAGSIVTGLLLGMTLVPDTPFYMIVVGAMVAQLPGKYSLPGIRRNLFNPAALGRAAIALLEMMNPLPVPAEDVVTSASPLFKDAGGYFRPDFFDVFLGFTKGAIGETSALILIFTGTLLLLFVAIKREAAIAMLVSAFLLVVALPPSADIVGHAPWVLNPVIYLFGGSTLLCAFFYATDPVTTPNTRSGGILFGIGAALISVLFRLYTTIPGAEVYGILIMNFLTPGIDYIFQKEKYPLASSETAKSKNLLPRPEGAGTPPSVRSPAMAFGLETFYATDPNDRDNTRDVFIGNRLNQIDPFGKEKAFTVIREIFQQKDGRKYVLDRVRQSALSGCGGSHYPVAAKWDALCAHPHPRYLIVNALEEEGETFKDRSILQFHTHLFVEGVALAAYSIEAEKVFIVVDPSSEENFQAVKGAVADLMSALDGNLSFSIQALKGPGLYVCGEETALIEFLEGRRGEPHIRPPFPTEKGLWGCPTVVHNVETLSWIPTIVHSETRWRSQSNTRLKLVSLSGAVRKPGVYEIPLETTLSEILSQGGGLVEGKKLKAFAIGGFSGAFLPESFSHLPLEQKALQAAGATLGSASIGILATDTSLLEEALSGIDYLQRQSCGRCTPCRVGTAELYRLWKTVINGWGDVEKLHEICEIANLLTSAANCGLGRAAPRQILSIMQYWPDELMFRLNMTKTKENVSFQLPDQDATTRNIIFQTPPDLSKLPVYNNGRKFRVLVNLLNRKKIKIFIDRKVLLVSEGTRLLDAIRGAGIVLSTLCDLPGFPFRGICRLCMVRIKGMSLPILSCSTIVKEGMVVNTCSPDLQANRKLLMEFVLAEHGECGREDCSVEGLARKFGVYLSRFQAKRQSAPDNISSNYLRVRTELCIHCDRCIRACPYGIIGRINRGKNITITFDHASTVDTSNCIGCGNCVAVCPSGSILRNTSFFSSEDEALAGLKITPQPT